MPLAVAVEEATDAEELAGPAGAKRPALRAGSKRG
jgi:hypothetical protein